MNLSAKLFKSAVKRAFLAPAKRSPITVPPQCTFASRDDCGKDESPRCGSKNLAKSPCEANKKKDKGKKKSSEFVSMWENPDCCKDPCPDVFPRFDELYYKTSDKAKRVYKQTWVECPKLKIAKKPLCRFDKLIYPPLEKRPRKARPKTARSSNDADLMSCFQNKADPKCAKITLPGCKMAREPPKCKQTKRPKDCKKICCPYPAFSECKKPAPKPLHPVECRCLDSVAICEVYAAMRKLNQQGGMKKKKD